jgi:manganese oxidase
MITRRELIARAGAIAGGAALLGKTARAAEGPAAEIRDEGHPGRVSNNLARVVTPNGKSLTGRLVRGVKVYHLTAEPVKHEFAPGLEAECWSYNGGVHGPTIEAVEGDRVRIYVTNKLPAPTSVHWHGVFLPNGMDGVSGLNQKAIPPGETFKYEFTLRQHGTFMYHSHFDEMVQIAMGLTGMLVVQPRRPQGPQPDRDFAIMLGEWKIKPGTFRPDPNEMVEFNLLTMNARAYPGTEPLVVKRGDRVRIRFGNLGPMDHHPIHLHGHAFRIVATEGGEIPEAGRWPTTTVLVPVGATRTVEFVADAPGDWAMHCHMTHHLMNQMGHGLPNLVGLDAGGLDPKVQGLLPGYMTMGTTGMGDMMSMPGPKNSIAMAASPGPFEPITMGGMFTILKVREALKGLGDPGWYEHPAGTVADRASPAELKADLGQDG